MSVRLQVVAVNNMVLNLRDFDHAQMPSTRDSVPELQFASNRFLGNIGAPIKPDQWENDDDIQALPISMNGETSPEAMNERSTAVPFVNVFFLIAHSL